MRTPWLYLLLAVVASSCGSAQSTPAESRPSVASNSALSHHSDVACRVDEDCSVCYRAGTCGEAIAANSAELEAPVCHSSPAAFCMPRRGHCDQSRCVAR
jgi:hypothetical protein